MQLAPRLVALFWLTVLTLMWCAGCTSVVRCIVEPSAEQWRWMTEVNTQVNDHEQRIRTLERDAAERERI